MLFLCRFPTHERPPHRPPAAALQAHRPSPLGKDQTPYRKISSEGLRVERVLGEEVLVVPREALRALAEAAFTDINHLLRPAHLASLKHIVEDPEASDSDVGSWPTTFSRTPTSPPAACCRCAGHR